MTRVIKKKKHHIRVVVSGFFLSFLIAIVIGLIYLRVQGFREALTNLVETSTNGMFQLEIEDTEIDYLELDFRLSEVIMHKSSDSVSSDLEEVYIAFIEVNMGSLLDVIMGGQFELEHFIIAEPIATISQKESSDRHTSSQPVNIAHEITMFYPGIKTILDHFNIRDFRIQRGGLTLQKPEKNIQFRLIDLLITEWNMKDLSEEADLNFKAGKQEIILNQSSFGFEEISFDYNSGELRIEGYSFDQVDSLGRKVVSVQGAAVIISNLDYEALMDEKYILQEIIIRNPRVTAHFYAHEKKEGASRQPISDLLKKNLGELLLHEGSIENARVSLFGYKNSDTLQIILPDLDFKTSNLVVTADSSTLMMERFNLNVGSTNLDLGNDLGISFSELDYDEGYNLTIRDIILSDLSNGEELITGSQIDMYLFNVFDYIYNEDLTADSVLITNGKILIDEDPSKFSSNQATKPERDLTQIHVKKVRLNNIDLLYNLANKKIEIRDLNGVIENIRQEESLSYELRVLKSPKINFRNTAEDLFADLAYLYLEPGYLKIGEVRAQKNELLLKVNGIEGRLLNFNSTDPLASHWQSLVFTSVSASGALPVNRQKDNTNRNPSHLQMDTIRIDQLDVSLHLNDSSLLKMQNSKIEIAGFATGKGQPAFDALVFSVPGINYSSPSVNLKSGPVYLDNQNTSSIEDLLVNTRTNDSIQIGRIEAGTFHKPDSAWELNELTIKDLGLDQRGNTFITYADSIQLRNARIHTNSLPYFSEIHVFGTGVTAKPAADSPVATASGGKKSSNTMEFSELFGKATIYPGSYALRDLHLTYEQIDINTEAGSNHVDIKNLALETNSSEFSIGRVETIGSDLFIADLKIEPKSSFIPTVETDIVGGDIDQLVFRNVLWEELLKNNRFIARSMDISDFNITMKRDKTLPDPPPVQKTHLLAELIPVSENFQLQQIEVTGGNLTYLETGDKTGKQGRIRLDSMNFSMSLRNPVEEPELVLSGNARLYGQGEMFFNYARLDSQQFDLEVRLLNFPVDSLNLMIDPLESIRLKSGHIHEYNLAVRADSIEATGQAIITYDDLHIEIFKSHEPDVRNFGSQLLTLLADGVILNHSKKDAIGNFNQERITFKGPINYWVKCAVHGAMTAIRKGKDERNVTD